MKAWGKPQAFSFVTATYLYLCKNVEALANQFHRESPVATRRRFLVTEENLCKRETRYVINNTQIT
jgi:hypothetical protein